MDPRYILIFLAGLAGGIGAHLIGAPMPFMIGGIFGAGLFVLLYETETRRLPKMSRWLRPIFMSVIGTMIGSRFSPELLPLLPQFWISALALIPFILLAHGGGYAIMRHIGRYEKRDAYFASLPGGIVDSAALAEAAGADLRLVTAQHFVRIVVVVVSVPLLFLVVDGHAVGSSAGETLASSQYDLLDVGLILIIACAGLFLGRLVRLPVSHMMGPLLLSLILSLTGVVHIDFPGWLANLAQFVIGSALGAEMSGISRRLLARSLGVGLVAGAYMLMLAGVMATIMINLVPAGFGAMFVSFAAGGLAEMSLIALSLNFNPVVVALHHLARILLTISIGSFLFKRLMSPKDRNPPA